MPKRSAAVRAYWLEHYVVNHMCSLCANTGEINTAGLKTKTGVLVGRFNWCICPNGQAMRYQSGMDKPHVNG